ncbi:MAG: hypothetical protein RR659_04860, partial [Bacilli bacterium]
GCVIIYAKKNFINIDYKEFSKNSVYNYIGSVNSKNKTLELTYDKDLGLSEFFIDSNVKTIDDLKEISDYILVVENKEKPIFKGNGIINKCKIVKVIKGNYLKVNDIINIYDLVYSWNSVSSNYIGGNTPLKINDVYIAFLKKTKNASINDSFVYNNVKYGRVSILNQRIILTDYEYGSMTIEEISDYDYVFSPDSTDEIDEYITMVKDIRDFAKKNMQ